MVASTGTAGTGYAGTMFESTAVTGDWPAWLDGDDFDGLGEDGWLGSLAGQEFDNADLLAEDEGAGPDLAAIPGGPSGPDDWFGLGGAAELMEPGVGLAMLVEGSVAGGSPAAPPSRHRRSWRSS
jgi:hypothetical protein